VVVENHMISNEFVARPNTEDRLAQIRSAYNDLGALLEKTLPASRHRSLAATELKSSSFWAMKAAAIAIATEAGDVNAAVEQSRP
jgi:hypothetical protein